jgi:hypothetical protein
MRVTRNEVRRGSPWWVTYGLATNDCTEPIRIRAVDVTESRASGIDWLDRVSLRPRPESDASLYALWPATDPLDRHWTTAVGANITAGQRIQIIGQVVFSGGNTPRPVPEITVSFSDGSGAEGALRLAPSVAFCGCPLP